MKLKLYKARKLEKEIGTYLREQHNEKSINFRVKDREALQDTLDNAEKEFLEECSLAKELIKLQFEIRKAIEEVNFKSGISSLMNEREYIQASISKVSGLSKGTVRESLSVNQDLCDARLMTLNNPDSYYQPAIRLAFLSKETVEALNKEHKDLKKKLEEVVEKLASLNLSKEITLTESQENLLKKASLI